MTILYGLSIYGGNDVHPPPTISIIASLGLEMTPVNSTPLGHGGFSRCHLNMLNGFMARRGGRRTNWGTLRGAEDEW
jgi:hypothetical protein